MAVEIWLLCGPTCSGKSSVASKLQEATSQGAVGTNVRVLSIVRQDDYFKPPEEVPLHQQTGYHNYDVPDCIDWTKFREAVRLAVAEACKREQPTTSNVVLVEGFLLLCDEELARAASRILWLQCPREVCRQRRDERERSRLQSPEWLQSGYIPEPVGYFERVAWPCYEAQSLAVRNRLEELENGFDEMNGGINVINSSTRMGRKQGNEHADNVTRGIEDVDGTRSVDEIVREILSDQLTRMECDRDPL